MSIYKYKDLKYFGKITIKKQKVSLIWMLNKFLDEKYRMHLKNISLGITTMCIIEEIFLFIINHYYHAFIWWADLIGILGY